MTNRCMARTTRNGGEANTVMGTVREVHVGSVLSRRMASRRRDLGMRTARDHVGCVVGAWQCM